jgi:signal transduction histidine kinase
MAEGGRPARRPRLAALTVEGWFGVAFAVLAVLALVAAVIVAEQLTQRRTLAVELEDSVLPAQAQAYRLQGALVDQETGIRGYGITGQAMFLQPYTAGRVIETDAEARLRTLIGGNELLAADLDNLERASNTWRRTFAVPIIALAGRGPLNGKDNKLLDRSKHSFDHLRTLFAAQNSHLSARAAYDAVRLNNIRNVNNWTLWVILAAFLLASAALALMLHSVIVRPLSRLSAAVRRVAGGDFGHRIEPTSPADLRAVAADIEAMRSKLVGALGDARTAQAVAARQATDLDVRATELLRSNADLEQFAYVASHDLQEPLRTVASFCQLLNKRYGDQIDERGRQYIDLAVDGAKRLETLVNDLLAFSRVGRANEIRARLSLDRTVDISIANMGVAIEESGAVIERPGLLPEVVGDATLLVMLWQNLIGNGIKFRVPGRPPVVRITAAQDAEDPAGMWQFRVADNGIGIAPEFAEKVFIIFQRLHGRNSYAGTGIGLALCRKIVNYHGGEISLDTGYADGARICFTLPRIPAEQDRAGEDSSAAPEGVPA